MRQVWKKVWIWFLGGLLSLILMMPIVVYVNVFGYKVSNKHQVWGEMGSAMSGIYGPILTILTVSLLIHQLRLQQQTNKHTFDQWFLQDTKADVEFYLIRLAEVLNKPLRGQTVRDVLRSNFGNASVQELEGEPLRQITDTLHRDVPSLGDMWSAMYGVIAVLEWVDDTAYKREFVSAKLKAQAMLSQPTCIALDNYLFCRAPDEYRAYRFQFSRNLAKR
jgi:hypothetical protein